MLALHHFYGLTVGQGLIASGDDLIALAQGVTRDGDLTALFIQNLHLAPAGDAFIVCVIDDVDSVTAIRLAQQRIATDGQRIGYLRGVKKFLLGRRCQEVTDPVNRLPVGEVERFSPRGR